VNQGIPGINLRPEEMHHGMNFMGSGMTPGHNHSMSVYGSGLGAQSGMSGGQAGQMVQPRGGHTKQGGLRMSGQGGSNNNTNNNNTNNNNSSLMSSSNNPNNLTSTLSTQSNSSSSLSVNREAMMSNSGGMNTGASMNNNNNNNNNNSGGGTMHGNASKGSMTSNRNRKKTHECDEDSNIYAIDLNKVRGLSLSLHQLKYFELYRSLRTERQR
jgi:hypothetical protein